MKVFKLEGEIGESIQHYAKRLVTSWKIQSEKIQELNINGDDLVITGDFNSIALSVYKDTTIENIINNYHQQLEENQRQYEQSDEYKERKRKDDLELQIMQDEMDELIEEFTLLDLSNSNDVVKWLYKIKPYTDRIGVESFKYTIVSSLINNGYKANENTGDNFKENDKENVARYLIGQCIDGLNIVGAIHPMMRKFTEDWAKKFNIELR